MPLRIEGDLVVGFAANYLSAFGSATFLWEIERSNHFSGRYPARKGTDCDNDNDNDDNDNDDNDNDDNDNDDDDGIHNYCSARMQVALVYLNVEYVKVIVLSVRLLLLSSRLAGKAGRKGWRLEVCRYPPPCRTLLYFTLL